MRRLAVESFVATECEGMARIDFFVRPDGEVVVNEINTIPGFTATSVYAKLFEASGISYAELLDRLIELALERHERRSRLVYLTTAARRAAARSAPRCQSRPSAAKRSSARARSSSSRRATPSARSANGSTVVPG